MLGRKLFAVRTRNILGHVTKRPFGTCHVNGTDACQDKSQNLKSDPPAAQKTDRCSRYQRSLARCPKTPSEQLCSKKSSANAEAKCTAKIAVDDYHEACSSIESAGNDILTRVDRESQSIADALRKELRLGEDVQLARLLELTRDAQEKFRELVSRDASCATAKRREMLLLNDEAGRALRALEREVEPCARGVVRTLRELRRDVSVCVDRAIALVRSCRSHETPRALTECVSRNAADARKMLDRVSKEASDKTSEVTATRDKVALRHREATDEVMATYRERMARFSAHLEDCIRAVEGARK